MAEVEELESTPLAMAQLSAVASGVRRDRC